MRVRRSIHLIGAMLFAADMVLIGAGPAHAAAPTSDTFGGTTAIGAVPFTTTVDTSEATTDADDVNANTECGAPSTDASVWYSITPEVDGGLVVNVSVLAGSP